MPTPRRSVVLFEAMVENPNRALRESKFWSEPVCRRWLDRVDDLVHSDRRKARAAGILGVRLALRIVQAQSRRRIRNRCVLALAVAVLASVHRADGNLERARVLLSRAEWIAQTCRDGDLWAEVHLRQGYRLYFAALRPDGSFDPAMLAQALRRADLAVRSARGRLAEARARNCRSNIREVTGSEAKAAEDARWALDAIDPAARQYDHIASLSCLVAALSRSGSREDRDNAAIYLEDFRVALPPRSPELRARLLWCEALVLIPNRRRRGRARRRLSQALTTFTRRGMKAEAVAVLAELVRLRPEGAVPQLCAAVLPILDPGVVRDLVADLGIVRMVERTQIAERLRAMVSGPGILPPAVFPAA
jgi:hypothetical protein